MKRKKKQQRKIWITLIIVALVMILGFAVYVSLFAGKTTEVSTTAESQPTTENVVENNNDNTQTAQEPEKAGDTETEGSEAEKADDNQSKVLTEEQALAAIKNYYQSQNGEMSSEEAELSYWDVSTGEDNKIVVLFRSYTAAQIRYYIDPGTGDTYVTEFVPGVTDEEQKTAETLNAWDYVK